MLPGRPRKAGMVGPRCQSQVAARDLPTGETVQASAFRDVVLCTKIVQSTARAVEALGLAMRRHRMAIIAIQWVVVACYFTLLVVPALLPLPCEPACILESMTRFAQFAFWGVWWPFVILVTMLLGRVWCGVFCPEGALTEWASRYGLGRRIPGWVKWGGWPFVAFVSTTLYGQLVSVYEYPKPAVLILGGSTLAAVTIGFLYGRNKRVWCRYLCPVSGVFGLLAKLAPLHYRVDQSTWNAAPPGRRTSRGHVVNCAPLIDIRRMRTASPCHMCGRCAGERNAVRLSPRSPNAEILATPAGVHHREVMLLVFGLLGIALGAFQWSASPWLVTAKQLVGAWLIDHDWTWMLQDNAAWWMLTNYPEKNEVFTWLDGALILAYIFATAITVATWCALCLYIGGAMAGVQAWRLAYALLPLAGLSTFLGLSALTATLVRAQGVALPWIGVARSGILLLAVLWSARLAAGIANGRTTPQKIIAVTAAVAASSIVVWLWVQMFYVW